MLRAFSQGCTALTGVEAVSNGVPSFKPPKSRNAATTLSVMGALTVTLFAGITTLALIAHVRVAEDAGLLLGAPAGYEQKTVITQVAAAVSGEGSALFYLVAGFTAAILVLAANTAYNGFPILASLLGQDGYLPKQFSRRGDRLVFSNGVVILAVLSGMPIWTFDASTTKLIQLYIIGVFVSFALSQTGMVRHWTRNLTHGAWIVTIAMPGVFLIMKAIHRHYDRLADDLTPPDETSVALPSRIHAVVLVSRLHAPTLRALAFARATRPSTLRAVTVRTSAEDADALQREWTRRDIPVPLTVLDSPFRDITGPVLDYVAQIRQDSPRDLIRVFVPE